jgi:predicted ATPase/transcriptional regulator with XRE-family HTH domain
MTIPEYSFGHWVKRRRKSLDLTQHELAERLGCSLSLIFKIESDERRPSRQIAELLAKYLEIPSDQRELFLKVARQEIAIDGLGALSPLSEPRPVAAVIHAVPIPRPLRQSNLPLPLTPLLGREHELQAILRQIQDPACRLLTLTGPGGVGKTRLALEAAHRLQDTFSDGVCFISLAGTNSYEFIVPAIAEALGYSFSGTLELKTQLFQLLKEKHILLGLDNLEHLLDGIELLDELLIFTHNVKLFTTSREPLNLRAEWAFEVQGLPVPANIELRDLESNSAAALFMRRARQVKTNFTPSREDAQAIAHICRLVDGLPLGLELAAAWVRVMSAREIAQEIERNLDFLTTTARDIPARHRSIRAVFDQSWSLLTDEEQRILRQLTVFSGGFTRESAKHVVDADLPQLSALVDKFLLRYTKTHASWYDFHELIRQYIELKAQEDLEEHDRLHERHAGYYAAWLYEQGANLQGPQQQEILSRISLEIDNVRSAWTWMVAHRQIAYLQQSLESLFVLHDIRNWLHEGSALFEQALASWLPFEKAGDEQDMNRILLGELMVCQGHMVWHLGHAQKARELLQSSLELLGSHRNRPMLAEAVLYLSLLEHSQGDYVAARRFAEECLSLNQELGRSFGIGYALSNLGMVCLTEGRHESAYNYLKESVEVMRTIEHPRGMAINLTRLGLAALRLDKLDEAQEYLEAGLEITRRLHDRWGTGNALNFLGGLALKRGDLEHAETLLRDSVKLAEEDGDQILLTLSLTDLGFILHERDPDVRRLFLHALQVSLHSQNIPAALYALTGVATVDAKTGVTERAFQLALYSRAHPSSNYQTKSRAERLCTELEAQLTPQQVESIQDRVRGKTFDALMQGILNSSVG